MVTFNHSDPHYLLDVSDAVTEILKKASDRADSLGVRKGDAMVISAHFAVAAAMACAARGMGKQCPPPAFAGVVCQRVMAVLKELPDLE